MEKRLFLTGPSGWGKSTAILEALGEEISRAGGFRTVRLYDETGLGVRYQLQSPSGNEGEVFLDCTRSPYRVYPDVFSGFGVRLLKCSNGAPFLVFDEIGGIELLREDFVQALESLLHSDIPCIGVMKEEGLASKLITHLGKEHDFYEAARRLRRWMQEDPDTLLLPCGQFDAHAKEIAKQWVMEYVKKLP